MTKFTSSVLALLALTSTAFAAPSTMPVQEKAGDVIPGSYIITLKQNIPNDQFDALMNDIQSSIKEDANSDVKHVYNIGESFKGFSGTFDASFIESLKEQDMYNIEENRIITLNAVQNNPSNWGLSRVGSKVSSPDFTKYEYPDKAGEGVTAYIVDTGCRIEHEEFEGRASQGFSSFPSKNDGNGHGTHVAATVAGKTSGVAKKSTIVCVKVLSDSGSGSIDGVVAGINFVAENAKGKKAVANMSLGGSASPALDAAVENAIKAGTTFVVAAGNSRADACKTSPARVPSAVTVAASDKNNNQASFSNHGTCVDLYGPGVDINSAWIDSNTAYKSISGTSMASPHVCGVAAVYLSVDNTLTPEKLHAAIVAKSTKDILKGVTGKTPNAIAHVHQ